MKISRRRLQQIIRSVINEEAMMPQMSPRRERDMMPPMSMPSHDADYHMDDYDDMPMSDMPEDDMPMDDHHEMPAGEHDPVHEECHRLMATCSKEECCSQLCDKYQMIELMEGLICAAKSRDADCAEILAMCLS